MSISLKTINDVRVIPLKNAVKTDDNRPIRGADMFPEIYSNIFLCARKKSGKSVTIQNIIQRCIGPNTSIIAFCSTGNKDPCWITIRLWCEKHNIPFLLFPSLREDKVDVLQSFIHKLECEAEEALEIDEMEKEAMLMPKKNMSEKQIIKSEKEKIAKCAKSMFYGDDEDDYEDDDGPFSGEEEEDDDIFNRKDKPITKAEKRLFDLKPLNSIQVKDKYRSPEYLIILDDLSSELKYPSITSLLKKNRHFKCKVIISSQYLNDLKPEALKQLDYFILFKGMSDDKLERVIRDGDINIDFPLLKKLYEHATAEPFNFLYISTREDQYRKNFNQLYNING